MWEIQTSYRIEPGTESHVSAATSRYLALQLVEILGGQSFFMPYELKEHRKVKP